MAKLVEWTERYRPQSLDEVVGNSKAIDELRAWGDAWEEGVPEKRAVILAGTPGVGKTSAAIALARERGWGVVEMNASDKRNYDEVKRIATSGALNRAFTASGEWSEEAGRQLVILDEADNLFGRQDRGGIRAIIETVRVARQPIVLIANDDYELKRRGAALRGLTKTIKFTRVYKRSIPKALRRIAEAEDLEVEPGVFEAIAERSNGDLRAAVNDLQSLGLGRGRVTVTDLETLGPRDVSQDIFDALRAILYGNDLWEARSSVWDVPESPDHILLWVDENLPRIYTDPADRTQGLHEVARADIYLGRAQRKQQYRLWSYANDLMTAGVAVAKTQKPKGQRFQFPSWLKQMSRSRGVRATRDSAAGKLGRYLHLSPKRTYLDVVPYVRALMREEEELATGLTARLDLTQDELAYLLDMGSDTRTVSRILEGASDLREEMAAPQVAPGAFARFDDDEDEEAAGSGSDAGERGGSSSGGDGVDDGGGDDGGGEGQRSLMDF